MTSQLDPKFQAKLDQVKALQKELAQAFEEAKKYTGKTEKDTAVYNKIENILNQMAALTASDK